MFVKSDFEAHGSHSHILKFVKRLKCVQVAPLRDLGLVHLKVFIYLCPTVDSSRWVNSLIQIIMMLCNV